MEIVWPSGQVDRLSNVDAGQTITVEEGKGIASSRKYATHLRTGISAAK